MNFFPTHFILMSIRTYVPPPVRRIAKISCSSYQVEPVTVLKTELLEMLHVIPQRTKVYTISAPTKPAIYARQTCLFHSITAVQPLFPSQIIYDIQRCCYHRWKVPHTRPVICALDFARLKVVTQYNRWLWFITLDYLNRLSRIELLGTLYSTDCP